MLKLKKVAVTGGLSSGKSSVCRIFKSLGADVVSADDIVHLLLSPDTEPGQQVIHLLGSDIVVNGKIDRSKIAKKVFNQPELLKSLEKILHPAVSERIQREYTTSREKGISPLYVAEIPLLFEAQMEGYFDAVVVVQADSKQCAQRFQASTGQSQDEYWLRSSHQMPTDDKAKRANFVIKNNGTLDHLEEQVKEVFRQLTKTSPQ